jgi:hypothetical protein
MLLHKVLEDQGFHLMILQKLIEYKLVEQEQIKEKVLLILLKDLSIMR